MSFTLDRTDFPYLRVGNLGLAVGLLPVMKVQFEYFLGDPSGPGTGWYDEVRKVGPRAGWRTPTADRWADLFLTGVSAEEAVGFADWLGNGFRLPTADEWRGIDRLFKAALNADRVATLLADPKVHPAARTILNWVWVHRKPADWHTFALLTDGLAEWVLGPAGGHGVYGYPEPKQCRLLVNPQKEPPRRLLSKERQRGFGFRLVRPLT